MYPLSVAVFEVRFTVESSLNASVNVTSDSNYDAGAASCPFFRVVAGNSRLRDEHSSDGWSFGRSDNLMAGPRVMEVNHWPLNHSEASWVYKNAYSRYTHRIHRDIYTNPPTPLWR